MNIFDISDIEEKTIFEGILMDQYKKEYNAKCRLWKPKEEKIRIFCRPIEILSNEYNYINFINTQFIYKNYIIYIISEIKSIRVEQKYTSIPFLYSDVQEINANKYQDSYEIKFKIDSYNNEKIGLFKDFTQIILDNCKLNNSELICKLTLEKIEEILDFSGSLFNILALNDNYGIVYFDSVFDIKINYNNITKEDIYIGITKLLKDYSEIYSMIAYETNISSIENVISRRFSFSFNDSYENYECIKDNINIKYNFRIQPVSNNETFTINNVKGNMIYLNQPLILDFTQKNSIIIRYSLEMPVEKFKIRLNPNSEDIVCEPLMYMAKCIIPLSHFNNATSGYYNTYYINNLGQLSIYYDANPFYVILPEKGIELQILEEDNLYEINIGLKGTLYFITNYNDTEYDIFNISDIEIMET